MLSDLKRCRFYAWVGKIPWCKAWQPTPVFLPGESHGQRSLAGYSLQGHTELDTEEKLIERLTETRLKGCRPCTHPDVINNPSLNHFAVKLLSKSFHLGPHSFRGRSLLCPPLSGKGMKLFSTSPKTLSLRFDSRTQAEFLASKSGPLFITVCPSPLLCAFLQLLVSFDPSERLSSGRYVMTSSPYLAASQKEGIVVQS